jgi:hypothetical protein
MYKYLGLTGSLMQKEDTVMTKSISPKQQNVLKIIKYI